MSKILFLCCVLSLTLQAQTVTVTATPASLSLPASLAVTNGFVDSAALNGVTVTVAGFPAPMIYVSQGQVTVQVPYEALTGTGKQLTLTNGANPTVGALVTINSTSPGIFTANGSGLGQAAALNVNSTTGLLSLNGSANMAKIGDTVVLYLTGEGDYNPTPFVGVQIVVTSFPRLSLRFHR